MERHIRDILVRPLVTEKSTRTMSEANAYTFQVPLDVTKVQVQQAVERLFKVHVVDVRTMRVRGKSRRMGRFVGKRPDWKKAIVKLAPGERIEIFEGV
ncbi:MAG: 50S ribosomal protein L23 [Limnochordaceae bacterium]|uniref:Large ribosomal subunit protein uL23 n=1 Tax=Carboxydichorda subterranea TaxID=3109565 RepID=A0ABZ1BYP4_9FIRM|nr:50S ribosomal protein L23 [Limnochorda sp. L945t]MBE3599033.1 50S ribosomal protein L23 [Limnochordaceae bacterium]WRP17718.1 50S ribosomal protein L23 [Limnochorda sp. L945t]